MTNCTIAVVKMIKPQNEWVYFELILSETEESVSQESLRESSDPMSTSLTDKLF